MIGIMKKTRLFSLLLATLMFGLTLVSCTKPAIAATAPDQTIPAGIFILIVNDVFSEASKHEDFDAENADVQNVDVLKNKIEDQPIAEWVDNKAQERLKQFIAVNALFDQKGLSLSKEEEESITTRVDSTWDDSAAEYERRGVSKQSLLAFEQNVSKKKLLFNAYYDKDGTDPVSDDALKALFTETYIAYYYTAFPFPEPEAANPEEDKPDATESDAAASASESKTDSDAEKQPQLTQEQKDEVKKQAEAVLARAKAGEKFTDLVDEQNKKIDPTAQPSAEQGPALLRKDEAAEGLGQDLLDQGVIGTPVLLSSDDGYYLFLTSDPAENEKNFLDTRETLLNELKNEDFLALLTEEASKIDIKVNSSVLNEFSFKNRVKKKKI